MTRTAPGPNAKPISWWYSPIPTITVWILLGWNGFLLVIVVLPRLVDFLVTGDPEPMPVSGAMIAVSLLATVTCVLVIAGCIWFLTRRRVVLSKSSPIEQTRLRD
ncbi:hypothetical protein [Salinibacterium sp. ZJ454]|uniref:hypothetical protein n=1 Tax=Salinibacterium sp. ZJ454 TaxID=2708339 RepID=UPI00141FA84C|nr:hypothetical protein [Salinibacterium sp. ZJ454]